MKILYLATFKHFESSTENRLIQQAALYSWGVQSRDFAEWGFIGSAEHLKPFLSGLHPAWIQPTPIEPPRLDYMIQTALECGQNEFICLINSDIILAEDATEALIGLIEQHGNALFATAIRRDIRLSSPITSRSQLQALEQTEWDFNPKGGSDLFLAHRDFWRKHCPPSFVIGRYAWDNWLHAAALKYATPAIDASKKVKIYHPLPKSFFPKDHPDVAYNVSLYRRDFGSQMIDMTDQRWLAP